MKICLGRRAVLFGFVAVFSVPAVAERLKLHKQPSTVLFICQAGTVKSAIARELFRRQAHERGLHVTAFSRGIVPEEHVSPGLRERLVAEDIDTTRDGLQKLTIEDLEAADIVVFFNPLPNARVRGAALDWSATPSMNDNYALARADLDRRIEELLNIVGDRQAK